MSKKGLRAILNNGIEFFIGSVILIIVTNRFSTEEAGAWIVFLTIILIGTKFREGITQTSLSKFSVGVSQDERTNVYLLSLLITLIIEAIMGSGMLLIALIFEFGPLSILLKGYFVMIMPQALFRMFQFISQSRLEVENMLSSNLVLLNITSLSLAYLILEKLTFDMLPIVIGGSYLISLFWQLFMHNVFSWKANWKSLYLPKGYLNFAVNGLLRELFGTISSKAYIILTAGILGYTESAFVGIASRYANLIYLPNTAYQGLLYPRACELVNNGLQNTMFSYYRRAITWMQAAFIPYVLGLIIFGSVGILVLHGVEYLQAIPFFTVLILAGAFISPYGHAFGSICLASGRPDLVTKLVVFNSVLNLALSLILIAFFGVWGAVLSPIITDLLGLVMISKILKRVFNTGVIEPFNHVLYRLVLIVRILIRKRLKNGVEV